MLALLVLLSPTAGAAEPGVSELFERARSLEAKNRNLTEAIRLYALVVTQAKSQRALAARAQYQHGVLLERLGRNAEAAVSFRAVLRDFPDQAATVRLARSRLPAKGLSLGMSVRQIWPGGDNVYYGGPSPDGRWLSFGDWASSELAIRDIVTGERRRLAGPDPSGHALSSLFSPDGTTVAYVWEDTGYEIRLAGIAGARPRTLWKSAGGYTQLHDWSPDGSLLLASAIGGDTSRILLLSSSDGRVLLSRPFEASPAPMKFSPDGKFIFYVHRTELRSLSIDGKEESVLIESPGREFPICSIASGNHLLFASDRTGALDLWDQIVAGGKANGAPRLLKQDIGRMAPLGCSRNGTLYYELNTSMFDVFSADFDERAGRVLSAPRALARRFIGSNRYPSWSPDARSILYASSRPDRALVVHDVASGQEKELRPRLRQFNRPAWSPDGAAIIVWGVGADGQSGFYRVDANSAEAKLILNARLIPDLLPDAAWSRDGRSCYAYSPDAIFRIDLESQTVEKIFTAPGKGSLGVALLSLSPDERELVFQLRNSPKGEVTLRLMPVSGGEAATIFRQTYPQEFHCCRGLSWTADGRSVVAAQGPLGETAGEVWIVPVRGGPPVKTGLTMAGLRQPHLDPAGKRIVFQAGEFDRSEVWAMENLPLEEASRR